MSAKTEAAAVDLDAEEGAATEATDSKAEQAARVVRTNVYWSMGAGLIPWPIVDTAAVLAVQLKMLKELGDVYGVPFKANAGKSAVASLLASVVSTSAGQGLLGARFMRVLRLRTPVIGTILGLLTMPVFNGAFTYAVGKVFNRHFASGGTFMSFDAKAVEPDFKEAFEEGKQKAKAAATGAAPAGAKPASA